MVTFGCVFTSRRGHHCKGLPFLNQKGTQINFTCKQCHGPGLISRPSDYKKSVLTSRPERCTSSCKSATGICRNITPPNPFTHGDKDFHPPYYKCCPSVGSQPYTVMFPFTSTLRQYGGFRLCVHITSGSPNVKDLKSTLHV